VEEIQIINKTKQKLFYLTKGIGFFLYLYIGNTVSNRKVNRKSNCSL